MAYLSKEEKQKIKNALKIKKSLDKEEDDRNLRASSPESEDIDFKKVIHPLGYYIHDREQMIEEMFSIIKGEKLRKMLPPLLKNYSLEELKADCLVHLLGMSRKRIMGILEGRELNSSSDSESESSTTPSEPDEAPQSPNNKLESRLNVDDDDLLDISISEKDVDSLIKDKLKGTNKSKKTKARVRKKIKTEKDVPLFSIVISDNDLDDTSSKNTKKVNRKHASTKLNKISSNKEKGKKRKKSETFSKSNFNRNTSESSADEKKKSNKDTTAPINENDKGKTLLEILELEMRARAIRALLKNTSDVEEGSSDLADTMKPKKEAANKSDPKITNAIVEAIDQTLADKNLTGPNDDLSESGNDVEIIDDIDLCVLIDDDDEISLEPDLKTPASQPIADEKCDSKDDPSEKCNQLKTDASEKEKLSKNPLKKDSKTSKLSKKDSKKNKSNKLVKNESEKHNHPKDGKPVKRTSSKDYFEKNETSKDENPVRSVKMSDDNSEKFETSPNDSSEKQCSIDNKIEKCEGLEENNLEKSEPLQEKSVGKCESEKNKLSEQSEKVSNLTDITWSERWAEKQNVKEVVRNSKICANIRKRMRFARMLKQKQSEECRPKIDEIDIGNVDESSVAHYDLIKAYTSKNVSDTTDHLKSTDEQSVPTVKTSQEAPENNDTDVDITTEDHTLTILENDPKTLIIDISDDEVIPDSC